MDPGLLKRLEHIKRGHAANFCNALDFNGTETIQVHLWMMGSQVLNEFNVPRERERWVHPALHEDACASNGFEFTDSNGDLFERLRVLFLVARWAVKRTELTVDGARVGVVDVAIDEVGHVTVRVHFQTSLVCCPH